MQELDSGRGLPFGPQYKQGKQELSRRIHRHEGAKGERSRKEQLEEIDAWLNGTQHDSSEEGDRRSKTLRQVTRGLGDDEDGLSRRGFRVENDSAAPIVLDPSKARKIEDRGL
jgi:hypothetical protein